MTDVTDRGVIDWVVCVATAHELRPLTRAVGWRVVQRAPYLLYEGARGGRRIAALQTGPGPERARQAISWLLTSRVCRGVLSVGLSGALQSSLVSGSIVISDRWVWATGRAIGAPGESPLRARAVRAAKGCGYLAHGGDLLTLDRVISGVEEKRVLAKQTGAAAVDMESGAIAEAALAASIDVVAVRVIFDALEEPLEVLPGDFLRPDGSLSVWRSALTVAKRPSRLPALWALGRRGRRGMELVAGWLCCFLDE